jgi:hypothetical protein
MKELDKIAIGERIKEFAIKKYGKIKPLGDQFGMGYNTFHSTYIQGRSLPGPKIISKLIELGCDIDWLLHGERKSPFYIAEDQVPYNFGSAEIEKLKEDIRRLQSKLANIQKLLSSNKDENN